MKDEPFKSAAFQQAILRSERARAIALIAVFGTLLSLVLVRGGVSLAQGHRGEVWPFAVLLGAMTAWETLWLRFLTRRITDGREITITVWITGTFVEMLLPTAAVFLQVHTPSFGPQGALTSPAVLAYFLFIILSTLHLSPALARLAGSFAASGYAVVAIYVYATEPAVAGSERLLAYGNSFSYVVFLFAGGFAAGAVARQIRLHVVTALEQAESRARLEHDLEVARSIQQGLLPAAAPAIDGFDIAGWNKPADETGGDYFDWQKLDDGRLAVTLADVTGHGIGSALCMAACRSYARAGFATQPDLRVFLCRMNQLLYEDLPTAKFVTMAAGLLRPAEATLQLISAGHGPLLFYSAASDCFQSCDAQGVPLGMLPRASYSMAHELRFDRGDMLILVTDGFLEWTNARDEDFGEERLRSVVRAHREMPATSIISELYSAVRKFAGMTPQLDDLTALVVKRC
jgi:serine phosphatase RsbU (regulator of sigma subunit)